MDRATRTSLVPTGRSLRFRGLRCRFALAAGRPASPLWLGGSFSALARGLGHGCSRIFQPGRRSPAPAPTPASQALQGKYRLFDLFSLEP